MIGTVLLATGLFALAYGSWRGYTAARAGLLPLVREGDETRRLVDAARPIHARTRVQLAIRRIGLAVAWIVVAMYGLYLVSAGAAVAG